MRGMRSLARWNGRPSRKASEEMTASDSQSTRKRARREKLKITAATCERETLVRKQKDPKMVLDEHAPKTRGRKREKSRGPEGRDRARAISAEIKRRHG